MQADLASACLGQRLATRAGRAIGASSLHAQFEKLQAGNSVGYPVESTSPRLRVQWT